MLSYDITRCFDSIRLYLIIHRPLKPYFRFIAVIQISGYFALFILQGMQCSTYIMLVLVRYMYLRDDCMYFAWIDVFIMEYSILLLLLFSYVMSVTTIVTLLPEFYTIFVILNQNHI
jgi:hypothetical protein